eukprot:598497-Pleurochrysis_carterae.AAC.1
MAAAGGSLADSKATARGRTMRGLGMWAGRGWLVGRVGAMSLRRRVRRKGRGHEVQLGCQEVNVIPT